MLVAVLVAVFLVVAAFFVVVFFVVVAFLAVVLRVVRFLAGPLARLSASNSKARSALMVAGSSLRGTVTLVCPSVM